MALQNAADDAVRRIAWVLFLILAVSTQGVVAADDGLTLDGAARKDAASLSAASLQKPLNEGDWEATLEDRREQWLEMLGLSPLPPRTPLQANVTGTLQRGDYVVEKVHFQRGVTGVPPVGFGAMGNLGNEKAANLP